jgi:5'-3' exonuclease
MPVHAILGFLSIVWKLVGRAEADPITFAAAVFDSPGKTFRHEIYPNYKANRTRPPGLIAQLPLLREAARVLGLEPVEVKGFEADDVLATLATQAKAKGIRTTLVTSDKDLCQIIEDGVIEIVDPVQRVRMLSADVEKKFGVPPRLLPDLQALAGDSVDGIPGVPTIGLKTAAMLLRKFGSLDGVLSNLDSIGNMHRWHLKNSRSMIPTYLNLVTLRRDVPLAIDFETLRPRQVRKAHLMEMLKVLEAEDQFENLFGGDKRLFRAVEPVIDPLKWWRNELQRKTQTIPDLPQSGFYMRRLVHKGPLVAARIWREPETDLNGKRTGKETLLCELGGERADPVAQWGYLATQPIKESEYRHMMELAQWTKDHAPDDPLSEPGKPVDWNKVPTPF